MYVKNILLSLFLFLLIQACGGITTQEKPPNSPDENTSSPLSNELVQPMPVYNLAYQENHAVDSMEMVVTQAKNAYVLVDPFGDDVLEHMNALKSKGNQVSAYISAGTGENYRDDFSALESYLTPVAWPEWPNEFFVSQTTTGILPIMKKRIDKISTLGAHWVEFDNMDWLDEQSRQEYSLIATVAEAKAYINALCDYTHSEGMKCMAKNTVEGFEHFDGVTYESYHNEKNWWDKDGTRGFLVLKKPVIIVHYNERDCDAVYAWYKEFYHSDKISFICEDVGMQRYKHYNKN